MNEKEGIWKPKNGWRKSYINKILRARALIGEFQPHKKMSYGKRQPVGDPIPDYFPEVISKKLFYEVQNSIKMNAHYGGRNGKAHNLFGHIAKCGLCGAPMQYVNKGNNWRYLTCDNARRGRGCRRHSIPYKTFEELILINASELDVTNILPGNEVQTEISQLRSNLETIKAELTEKIKIIDNLTERIAKTPYREVGNILDEKMFREIEKQKNLRQKESKLESQIDRMSDAPENTAKRIQSIKELLKHMRSLTDRDELLCLRLKLRENVRRIIYKIYIFPPESKITTSEYEDFKKSLGENYYDRLLDLTEKAVIFLQMHYIIGNNKPVVQGIHFDLKSKEEIRKWAWIGDSTVPRYYRRLNYL